MEGNNNNLLKIIIALLVIIIIGGCVAGYFIFNNLKNNNNNVDGNGSGNANTQTPVIDNKTNTETENITTETNTTELNTTETNTTPTTQNPENTIVNTSSGEAKVSTAENPLKLGEWGKAAKYVSKYLSTTYENTNYVDVPARVTKVTRGSEAEKIVKEWFANNKLYTYEEPKAYTEWAVFDYEVDLSKLVFDAGTIGTSVYVNSDIKGSDGGSVKYNGISYILMTKDITGSDYVKTPGIYKCRFITTIPEGCKDYLITLGDSYSGALSYFKCEY